MPDDTPQPPSPPNDRVERTCYPDGTPQEETHYRGAKEHGPWRKWHPNGVLAQECWFEMGLFKDGISYSWDERGRIRAEIARVGGLQTGRMRVYSERGRVMMEMFAIDGKQVSEAAYHKACEKRPELPRYEPSPPKKNKPQRKRARREKADPQQAAEDRRFRDELLQQPSAEARQWLADATPPSSRSVGELAPQDSIAFIEELYLAGAAQVIAVEINGGPFDDDMSANHLMVDLPGDRGARDRLFVLENEHAEREGFDGVADYGQDSLFFKMC